MIRLKHVLVSTAFVAAALPAQAALTFHDSRADYEAATHAGTVVDFEAQNAGAYTPHGSSLKVGGVTFTNNAPRLFVISASLYATPFTSDYLNNNTQGTTIEAVFDDPVYGLALDFGTLFNAQPAGTPLTLAFTLAGESFEFTLPGLLTQPGTPLLFFGVTSDTAFGSLRIDDPNRGLAFDNFSYTAMPADPGITPAPVPEPGSLVLAGLGMAALTSVQRRRRAKARRCAGRV